MKLAQINNKNKLLSVVTGAIEVDGNQCYMFTL